jgi:hypothetical protein
MKSATSTTDATASPATKYMTLKSATASKLGRHADGSISYTIGSDRDRTALFVTITNNSSGGYFSREYVPFDRIEGLVAKLDQSAFPSKALKVAFAGKSSNNAGFLAAILHAEGLLTRASNNEAKHVMANEWGKWKTALLAQEGGQTSASLPSTQTTDASATPDKSKTLTVGREAGRSR